LKIPNISKQSGGADIKLNRKFSAGLKFVYAVIAGLLFCYLLYFLVDRVYNGSFLDWFSRNYMFTRSTYLNEAGQEGIVREPDWYSLKILLLRVFCALVILWIGSVFLISRLYAAKKISATLQETGAMIRSYMAQEKYVNDIFPPEYAGISTQLVQTKTTMLRHEQLMKEEAARKNDLITYLAHDLNPPLTSVIGYLSLLDEAPDMPEKQKARYIHIALDKANRLEKLINEFFEITRYYLQQIILEKETFDLYYLLVQLTDEFYPVLTAHGNTIRLLADENSRLYGDPGKLARVFNNILKNAVYYSYPDTPIEIMTEYLPDQVAILFRNRGKTIPPQKLQSIFEKFFRLDDARATNTGGAGPGLSIAREIITLHGGTVTADSAQELTTFRVTLPR